MGRSRFAACRNSLRAEGPLQHESTRQLARTGPTKLPLQRPRLKQDFSLQLQVLTTQTAVIANLYFDYMINTRGNLSIEHGVEIYWARPLGMDGQRSSWCD